MNKLLKAIDKLFNPKKYFDDRITKPIRRLKAEDTIYVLYIPIEKEHYDTIDFKTFKNISYEMIIEKGKINDLSATSNKEVTKMIFIPDNFPPTYFKTYYIKGMKNCNKNIINASTYNGVYYFATNKKDIVQVINTLNIFVETNFKDWMEKCQELDSHADESRYRWWTSYSFSEKLIEDLKYFRETISHLKHVLKLL